MMHIRWSRRLYGLVAGLALLLATLACNGSAVLVASTPKWACPSPTPKPYGPGGPVKQTEEYDCITDPITGVRTCKEREIYYAEWEQEYGDLGGPPFPSPTPYGIKGTSYPFGYRVAIGPIFALVDATVGQVLPDGQQLTLVHLQWYNPTAEAIPYRVNDLVRVRAITDPSGRIISSQRWGVTYASLVAAGVSALPTAIPSGNSAVSVPIHTPQGTLKTVELEFPSVPAAPGATPTPNPDLAAAPASLVVTWTRTTALSGCDDPGALTPWDDGPGVAWGHDAPIGTPAPSGTSRLIQIALQQVGKPYVWGAKGPEVFDCSGLTEWSYAQIGIRIPRGTAGQWPEMRPVAVGQLQPGDLVFFAIEGGRVDHVGLVADVNGDGQWDLIHAASPQYGVRVDLNLFGSRYYAPRITGFRTAR
jgi:cell wall-associated NlpC family hydrolase